MRPIPVLGSAAMFFSLIAAFVFAPWFAMRVRPKLEALEKAEKREKWFEELIGNFYRPAMNRLCHNKLLRNGFLATLIGLTFFACSMFYFQWVAVKMLPFDNKPEFNLVINLPEGTALPVTANVTHQLVNVLREIPEVTELQSYSGTASPFNFNGMVRHYYLRQNPWDADIQVMLTDKKDRDRGSHAIAVDARHKIKAFLDKHPEITDTGLKTQVVEMPPGPPVLSTLVAEIYGPDAETRRQVAADMTHIFETSKDLVDVDNYMATPHDYWRFDVDIEKATRYGISVDSINQQMNMAVGGFKLGDIKSGIVREPTYIVMQVPMAVRSQIKRLYTIPLQTNEGTTMPLGELGRFNLVPEDPVIFHKDLRPVEYVTAEMEGKLGAPIYGMHTVEDRLKDYITPDGVTMSALTLGNTIGRYGAPESDVTSGFEWTGEWTVTFETFRDMGGAFMAALVLIYGLIVWEFKNFSLAGLIMAPIPLTLIGIIPGHLIIGADFTATSMIGFIALAGIIVRNSILLVEFVLHEVKSGKDIRDAVITAGQIRMRPILITAGTLMVGAAMLFSDPIFIGMATSLFFGTLVSTVLTLVAIPLGCISYQTTIYEMCGFQMNSSGERVELCDDEDNVTQNKVEPSNHSKLPLWRRVFEIVTFAGTFLFYFFYSYLTAFKKGGVNLSNFSLKNTKQPEATPKKATPKEATPKKAAPKKAAPKKAAPKKAAPNKAAPNKAAPKKAAPKKAAPKKAVPKKAAPKKAAPKKAAPKKAKGKKRRGISLKKL